MDEMYWCNLQIITRLDRKRVKLIPCNFWAEKYEMYVCERDTQVPDYMTHIDKVEDIIEEVTEWEVRQILIEILNEEKTHDVLNEIDTGKKTVDMTVANVLADFTNQWNKTHYTRPAENNVALDIVEQLIDSVFKQQLLASFKSSSSSAMSDGSDPHYQKQDQSLYERIPRNHISADQFIAELQKMDDEEMFFPSEEDPTWMQEVKNKLEIKNDDENVDEELLTALHEHDTKVKLQKAECKTKKGANWKTAWKQYEKYMKENNKVWKSFEEVRQYIKQILDEQNLQLKLQRNKGIQQEEAAKAAQMEQDQKTKNDRSEAEAKLRAERVIAAAQEKKQLLEKLKNALDKDIHKFALKGKKKRGDTAITDRKDASEIDSTEEILQRARREYNRLNPIQKHRQVDISKQTQKQIEQAAQKALKLRQKQIQDENALRQKHGLPPFPLPMRNEIVTPPTWLSMRYVDTPGVCGRQSHKDLLGGT